jgi:pilus assembly protein CpaF
MSILKRIQGDGNIQPANQNNGSAQKNTPTVPPRRVVAPSMPNTQDTYQDLKTRVQNKLLSTLDSNVDVTKVAEVRRTIQDLFEQILNEENIVLSRPERARMFEQIVAEILGFGPLQPLLDDDSITEIMVNGSKNIYVERRGKIQRAPLTFENNDHVMRIIERIVAPLGRRIDESSPYVDARLPDGSRVNAVIPPISLVGPVLTIRKFARNPITVDQLIQFGSITPKRSNYWMPA